MAASSESLPTIVLDQNLVEAEKFRLRKMFVEIDTNRDGKIDIQELTQGLKRMGYFHITSDQVEVIIFRLATLKWSSFKIGFLIWKEFIRDCDTDKTGDLDKTEFVNYLLRHQQELRLVFATLDENKDGLIFTFWGRNYHKLQFLNFLQVKFVFRKWKMPFLVLG